MPRKTLAELYPVTRWKADFRAIASRDAEPAHPSPILETQDLSTEDHYQLLLERAHWYLAENLDELSQSQFVVTGRDGTLVKDELLEALWLAFMVLPLNMLDFPIPVETVIRSAEKQRRK